MNKPHPHKDLIIAWANGAEIQIYNDQNQWEDIQRPFWGPNHKYRIKPLPVIRTFRVALLNTEDGYLTTTADDEVEAQEVEEYSTFIAWLTDPIPYQVEELN